MKNLSSFIVLLFITNSALAQITPDQFYTPVNTGSNMTLGVNTDDLDDFIGGSLALLMLRECIGLEIIQNQFFSMAIWGDDTGRRNRWITRWRECTFAFIRWSRYNNCRTSKL